MQEITLFPISTGPFETNCYLAFRDKEAIIIDAPPDVLQKIKEACNTHHINPTHLILTHSHWDHIADAKKIVETFHIPLIIHQKDSYNMRSPGADRVPMPLHIEGVEPSLEVKGNETLDLLGATWQVLHTPGHTPGGICLYNARSKILFSGDTLFKGCCGNISLPTSETTSMLSSLHKLALLPKDTKVYPGHGQSTTIGQERWLQDPEKFLSV